MKTMLKLLIYYVFIGIFVATIFPFFANFFVIYKNGKFIYFFLICYIAGVFVGTINFFIIKRFLSAIRLKFEDSLIKNDLVNKKSIKKKDSYDDLLKYFEMFSDNIRTKYTNDNSRLLSVNEALEKKIYQVNKIKDLLTDSEIHAEKIRLENEELIKKNKALERRLKQVV